MSETAHLAVVGLGPGDPELVTIKGVRTIQAADLIFVPRSKDEADSIARQIAAPWLTPHQTVVPVTTPMTRDQATLRAAWSQIADEIAARLRPADGPPRRGAYLILGDPLLYGTFTYIADMLAQRQPQIEIQFIPGITSFAASAAKTQMPLAATSDRLAIIPASRETTLAGLHQMLLDFTTLVLMKAGPVFPQIMEALEQLALVEQAVYVERIGMPEEKIVQGADLRRMARQRHPYLSLMIVRRPRKRALAAEPATPARSKRAGQPLYPVNLSQVSGKRAVVVGGGPVGERKVKGLLAVGAQVELISPAVTTQLQAWIEAGRLTWQQRPYQSKDLAGAYLVFAATNQRATNAQVAQDAAALNLLSNIADAPEEGTFYLPALYRQPEVTVAVSTSGQSPGLAARIRDRIAQLLNGFED